ncbi:hypothetical protein BDV34DRAFT_192709 [Aspergillus parasiticus]|uniref:Uncharacterized protein n=1 Tax=Aspergillus parasiticus TaxID=5067 RepID=A0A5N6DS99_ASPPA|nr:hypothetical protein BDV34DRAFT_192709 [Aspergillus parasiticus]
MVDVPDGQVRLFARQTRRALFSRHRLIGDEFGHHPINSGSDAAQDQLFRIIRVNNGSYPYKIKSVVTGKVLFARPSGNPLFGHTDDEGYSDQTFRFEHFGGRVASFRIISARERVAVSRTSKSPQLTSAPTSPKYSDQEFYFWLPGWTIPRSEEQADQMETPDERKESTLETESLDKPVSVPQASNDNTSDLQ